MSIKSKLWIAFCACMFIALVVTGALVNWYSRALRLGDISHASNRIAAAVFELQLVTHDYLNGAETRALSQIASRLDEILHLIQEARALGASPQALSSIEEGLLKTDGILKRLLSASQTAPSDPELEDQADELANRLAEELFIQSYHMVSEATEIHRSSLEERERRLRGVVAIVLLTLALFVGVIMATLILGLRGVVRPLENLHHGTQQVASGRLDYQIAPRRLDEVGKLAAAFNEMTVRLKARTMRMQQSLEALESFSHSIAHDLRSPVRAIQSFTMILMEELGPQLTDPCRDYAQRIVRATTRLDALIHDLLSYSQVAHRPERLESIDLNLVLQQTLDDLADPINQAGAEVELPSSPPAVKGDFVILKKVLANLVSNSLKFVRPEVPPVVRIRTTPLGDWVRLEICDNGIGVDPNYHERIFRVFERLHPADTYPGTGIGLAIVFKGIERMGGKVGVESNVNSGACFWIELPAAEPVHTVRAVPANAAS